MERLHTDRFRVAPREKVDVTKLPTNVKPVYESKEHYKQILDAHLHELRGLQSLLYASNRYSLLLILQAMDAAGKDGIIDHVVSGVNPQGCQVYSFRHPGPEELEHDFLWNAVRRLPERGHIGIFNRSYYEEVLIVRVHPEILRAQRLPEELADEKKIWNRRFQSILNLEKHLHRNGTQVVKIFLHLSKEEQRKRLLARIGEPSKNWKITQADATERKYWEAYMHAYSECLGATSRHHSPWYVVPADDKPNARLIVSQILLDSLSELGMRYPQPSQHALQELKSALEEET